MRLLHFADLHLDTPFRWAGPELARARRRALRETLQRICATAAERRVDALTCGGDLFEHERFSPDTAEFLRASFAELAPLPVFLAPGNHDWYGPASLYRQVAWSPNVHVFDSPQLAPVALAEGVTLWGAAHCAPANTDGFLDRFRVDRGGLHLGLFHGSEQGELGFQEGGKVPHAPFRAAQVRSSGLHHALVGHFHAPRDAETHTYPGNPDPLTFGETGERAAVLLTLAPDGTVTRERIPVAGTAVHDLEVSLDGVAHAGQVRERVAAALQPLAGVVRLTLVGEVAPEVDLRLADLDGVAPHLQALLPRVGRVSVAYDFDALRAEQTVRGQFVRDVFDAPDLSDDERRRVLVTGLRALDGRADELEVA